MSRMNIRRCTDLGNDKCVGCGGYLKGPLGNIGIFLRGNDHIGNICLTEIDDGKGKVGIFSVGSGCCDGVGIDEQEFLGAGYGRLLAHHQVKVGYGLIYIGNQSCNRIVIICDIGIGSAPYLFKPVLDILRRLVHCDQVIHVGNEVIVCVLSVRSYDCLSARSS